MPDDAAQRDVPEAGSAGATAVPGVSRHTLLLSGVPQRHDAALTRWIGAALRDGHRVLLKHRPEAGRDLRRLLHRSGLDGAPIESGRIVLADAALLGARLGRRHELQADLVAQALALVGVAPTVARTFTVIGAECHPQLRLVWWRDER